jgi:hypothetical protein
MNSGRSNQKARILDRDIVGIEQQHFAKSRMQQSIRLEFPAAEPVDRVMLGDFMGVDRPGVPFLKETTHRRSHLGGAKIPDFDRQG